MQDRDIPSHFTFNQETLDSMSRAFRVFAEVSENVARTMKPILESLSKIDFEALQKTLDALPDRSKILMQKASSLGWFFGWDLTLEELYGLMESIDSATSSEIDQIFLNHYRKNFHRFLEDLIRRYPLRSVPIRAAALAHVGASESDQSGYYLSIPVFLAQADGIMAEVCGVEHPTRRKGGELFVADALRQKIVGNDEKQNLLYAILFLHETDLMKSAAQRTERFDALNRHQVLHGEISNYGTEINSLKAFSFLAHVGIHLPETLAGTG